MINYLNVIYSYIEYVIASINVLSRVILKLYVIRNIFLSLSLKT